MSEAQVASVDFEKALEELEQLVERLERGDMPLEQALKAFERGVQLTRDCQTALREAEQQVDTLLKGATAETDAAPLAPRD